MHFLMISYQKDSCRLHYYALTHCPDASLPDENLTKRTLVPPHDQVSVVDCRAEKRKNDSFSNFFPCRYQQRSLFDRKRDEMIAQRQGIEEERCLL